MDGVCGMWYEVCVGVCGVYIVCVCGVCGMCMWGCMCVMCVWACCMHVECVCVRVCMYVSVNGVVVCMCVVWGVCMSVWCICSVCMGLWYV